MTSYRVLATGIVLCISSAMLAGCPGADGGIYSPGTSSETPTPTPVATPTPIATPTPTPAPKVAVAVSTDKAMYKRGEAVKISIAATSLSAENQELTFPSGQSYDISIYDKSDALVWRWSRGRMFTMALRTTQVKPGQPLTFAATWNGKDFSAQNVAAGTYTVRAKLTAEGGIDAPDKIITVK